MTYPQRIVGNNFIFSLYFSQERKGYEPKTNKSPTKFLGRNFVRDKQTQKKNFTRGKEGLFI